MVWFVVQSLMPRIPTQPQMVYMATVCEAAELIPQFQYSLAQVQQAMGPALFAHLEETKDADKQDATFQCFTSLFMTHGPMAGVLAVELSRRRMLRKGPKEQQDECDRIIHENSPPEALPAAAGDPVLALQAVLDANHRAKKSKEDADEKDKPPASDGKGKEGNTQEAEAATPGRATRDGAGKPQPGMEPAAKVEPKKEEPVAPMTKAQLKNAKKHAAAKEKKRRQAMEEVEAQIIAFRATCLAEQLEAMGFEHERCLEAVCACSTGARGIDMDRCVNWMFSEQSGGPPKANLDITEELAQIADAETQGMEGEQVRAAVLKHGGDVTTALALL